MRKFACALLALSLGVALPLGALAGGGLVELVLPNQLPVSATNPLPVTGALTVTPGPSPQPVSQIGVTYATTNVSASGTSTPLLAANASRTYLLIQNQGNQPVWLGIGAAAVVGSGIEIVAGGNYEPLQAPTQAVNAISVIPGQNQTVIQGN